MSHHPLAVLAPIVGARSETFIQRHMGDLLPNKTVVVTRTSGDRYGGHWSFDGPMLVLDQLHSQRLIGQAVRRISREVRWRHWDELAVVARWIQKHHVQVVMGEYLDWSFRWRELSRSAGVRFFGHAHGYDISRQLRSPKWRAEYLHYNQSSGVITMSDVSRQRLVDLGLEPAKVHVVKYGVHIPPRPPARSEDRVIRCVAVGRMVAKKGPILTLDAFRRAAEACPSLVLDYLGEGELLAAAFQFVRAFDLGARVTLHGGQSNQSVQELLKRADIFVQHSMVDPETGDEEGLPVAILEAMARGLPVVSTRHAGIPEAVVEGETGYLVDEGDSRAMAERLMTLARAPDLRFRMGQAGWRRARDHFSWEREKKELLAILGLDT